MPMFAAPWDPCEKIMDEVCWQAVVSNVHLSLKKEDKQTMNAVTY